MRQGVKWHDGKPFTAADVKCTWDLLLGKASEKLRVNPRKTWYLNLEEVTTNGDYEVTFHLKRPQPALLSLLASGLVAGLSLPCAAARHAQPIRSAPARSNSSSSSRTRWSRRRATRITGSRAGPISTASSGTIMPDIATRNLAFIAGKLDITSPYGTTVPLLEDVKSQAPQAICELTSTNVSRNLILNPEKPPFDNAGSAPGDGAEPRPQGLYRHHHSRARATSARTMLPPPEGLWGMPPEMLATLPGYDPDVAKNRAEARKIMEKLGYGPDKRLAVTLSSRNIPAYRDPAVILIDQLREIYIDAELEPVETANWFPKIYRKDYTIAINGTESGVDDPDQHFYENFVCGAVRNYTGYCNPEVDKLIDRQSAEADREKRKQLVWEIERRLAEDGARPIIFYPRGGTCTQPYVKGLTTMVNSIYNGYRMEDVWLDK